MGGSWIVPRSGFGKQVLNRSICKACETVCAISDYFSSLRGIRGAVSEEQPISSSRFALLRCVDCPPANHDGPLREIPGKVICTSTSTLESNRRVGALCTLFI